MVSVLLHSKHVEGADVLPGDDKSVPLGHLPIE